MVQTYVNPLPDQYVDGAYRFPVYEGVAVTAFQAEVDGRKIVGKVWEKVAAEEVYQEAVKDGKLTASMVEQEMPDVFQARIGNIPPGKTVSIRITLVSEIKQDAGENQVRFVLPTTVAPRDGSSPSVFGFWYSGFPVSAPKLSVTMACAMSKPITSVQSPSHTIEVHVGHDESVGAYAFDPNRARVTLTEDSLLDRDLVIIIQSLELDQPRVLLERHPTEQTHAVSLSFQPRFALRPLRSSELIFLIDRSGPQTSRIGEALALFLRSIPFENHYFNVIAPSTSFSSTHSALFPTSVEHDAESLKEGIRYAQAIHANGAQGTVEMTSAIQEVVQRRRRGDVPMQIFLLTDGQMRNVQQLRRVITNAVGDGERSQQQQTLRVFTLGVGGCVSHHQLESVARAGGGYAQVVMPGERMEKKVVNMLKAGLTPPVTDTAIQWIRGDSIADNFDMVGGKEDADDGGVDALSKPVISLFSEQESSPPGISENSTPAPEVYATIYQAPFKLPVVCPGARFTVYAILSPTTPLPKEIILRGRSMDGPVELCAKVECVAEGESMLHSLAARALVRDLEETSSFIHALNKTLKPSEEQKLKHLGVSVVAQQRQGEKWSDYKLPLSFNHVAEITKQKMVDFGVRYGLSTKYTSWVAVDEEGPRRDVKVIETVSHAAPAFPSGAPSLCNMFSQQTPSPANYLKNIYPGIPGQSTGGLFGSSTPPDVGAQGQSLFGAITSNSTPAFGAIQTPAFGSSFTPTFGAGSTPAFGATQTPTFGAGSTPAFGATQTPTFGAGSTPAFGATQTPTFGAGSTPAFGATQTPAFGAGSTPAFGATQTPTFGSFSTPAFGANQTLAFGSSSTPAFGASSTPAFGVASSSPGGFSFRPVQGSLFGTSTSQSREVASPFSSSTSLLGSTSAAQAASPSAEGWWARDPHTWLMRSVIVNQYQSVDGLFPLIPAIAALFNTNVDYLKIKLGQLRTQCTGLMELAEEQWESIWATCLVLAFIKSKSKELQDEWKLVVEKAEGRVEALLKNSEHLERFKAAAKAP